MRLSRPTRLSRTTLVGHLVRRGRLPGSPALASPGCPRRGAVLGDDIQRIWDSFGGFARDLVRIHQSGEECPGLRCAALSQRLVGPATCSWRHRAVLAAGWFLGVTFSAYGVRLVVLHGISCGSTSQVKDVLDPPVRCRMFWIHQSGEECSGLRCADRADAAIFKTQVEIKL